MREVEKRKKKLDCGDGWVGGGNGDGSRLPVWFGE